MFYQNTLGEMDADDGSGEDYVANLERTFANVDQTTVWLGCPDCTNNRAALDAYVNIIQPKWTIPHHWDGPMSDVESGVATPFVPMEIYTQSLEAAGSNMTVPTQYFEPYLLQNGTLSKATTAPIRDAFNLSAQ